MLPLATTTVAVARAQGQAVDADPADPDYPDPTQVVGLEAVRAHIGIPSASSTQAGGTRVVYTAPFWTDPADIRPRDQLTDADGNVWFVETAKKQGAWGMDCVIGRVHQVEGAA